MGIFDKLFGKKKKEIKKVVKEPMAKKELTIEDHIRTLKNDEDLRLRSVAAISLGLMKDKRAVEPLVWALKDEKKEVRKSAADSIEKKVAKKRARTASRERLNRANDGSSWFAIIGGFILVAAGIGFGVLAYSTGPGFNFPLMVLAVMNLALGIFTLMREAGIIGNGGMRYH